MGLLLAPIRQRGKELGSRLLNFRIRQVKHIGLLSRGKELTGRTASSCASSRDLTRQQRELVNVMIEGEEEEVENNVIIKTHCWALVILPTIVSAESIIDGILQCDGQQRGGNKSIQRRHGLPLMAT